MATAVWQPTTAPLFMSQLMTMVGLLFIARANGKHDGVVLQLDGVTIPNNSLVDIQDLLYRTYRDPYPTNANGLHNQTLVCVTNLEDCCSSPRTVHGNWYYSDGQVVKHSTPGYSGPTFLSNRGPNEVRNGRQFYGSVRLFYRWSHQTALGRFRCELPAADNPSVNQTLYASVVDFGVSHSFNPVIISSTGTGTAGETYSLTCSATLVNPVPLPSNIATPVFEWFFGPSGNATLPSGAIPTLTVSGSGHTYTSSLQFSPLNITHSGNYTCRLGAGRLVNSSTVIVNASNIFTHITTSGSSVLGGYGFILTCCVIGANHLNPFITYQWTKDNGTQTQIQDGSNPRTVSFTPLRLIDVGRYTCQATISSPYFTSDLTQTVSRDVIVTIPTPTSVILSPPYPGIIRPVGSPVTLTCTVELSPVIDTHVTVSTVWSGPDGFMNTNTAQPVSMGNTTTYSSTATIYSFGRDESGLYACTATVHATGASAFIDESSSLTGNAIVRVGVFLSLDGVVYANNSIIQNTEIGWTDQLEYSPGLQCITDKKPCCQTGIGEWFFPQGTTVPSQASADSFYYERGADGAVSLYRNSTNTASPNGLYCCVIPDAADILQRVCANIISVQISGSVTTNPRVGNDYSLSCRVHGTDSVTAYRWKKDDILLPNKMQATLSFSSVGLLDAGVYTCEVTVDNLEYSTVKEITITIPSPTSVTVTSVPVSPIKDVGSAVTITCTVELSPAVDIPVTVTTEWTGPDGLMTTTAAQLVVGSTTTYASRVMINSFGRDESGLYSCRATVSSASLNPFLRDSLTTSSARVTVGTYLLFNGTVRANKSIVQITDIGETETLQCIVDRKPCCRNTGEWIFPNGTNIPTQETATVYYRSRGDDGSVHLHILNSHSTLPLLTGLFCCVVPDAVDTVQTVCADIKLTIFAGISDRGVTVAGQSYTLTCYVTGFDNFTPNLSYKWTKYNGTLKHVSIDSKTLFFSPLKLSDAGNYVCHVIARSDVTNEKVANTSSQSFEVNIVVPEPTVTLHSNLPKLAPILSKSSFTLTCAVELIPAIDVPVTVSTVWTGPDGRFIVPPTTAEMKSTTRYVSLKTLYSVESSDSGNYTCTIVVENGVEVSASTNIEIVDGIFQLKLTSVDICQKWYTKDSDEAEQYSHFIKEALVEAIEQKCKCHFPSTNLLDKDIFICEDSPNRMTYRNTLLGTHNFDGGRVIEFMQEWVSGGPLIRIGENYAKVDSSCPVAITSLYESTCQQKERSCLYGDDPTHAILCAKHLANRNSTTAACIEGCMSRNG